MAVILSIHSIVRWIIVIVAIAAAVKFAVGWRRDMDFTTVDRGLTSAFSGLIDVQVILGLIYFFWSGLAGGEGFPSSRIEHMVTMLVAAVVAHLSVLWKKGDDKTRFRNTLFIVLDTLIIIFFGIARLPRG
ncbi:MAG: hypothetical protein AB1649_13070 [Chloroflexota bacterium]